MRVLIVEDEQALGVLLKRGLETEGHQADWVADGEAALAYCKANCPDLMLLDLSLPKLDGMEVLAELQGLQIEMAVMVLTGRSDLEARVQCLELGADDCLLKPFSFSELTARCRALLRREKRRRAHVADTVLRHGDLELHRAERWVSRGGKPVVLTTREFALLEYLLLHAGECISRDRLLAEVWQTNEPTGTNIVDVYVNYVRRKVDTGAELIKTVRGFGYRLGHGGPGATAIAAPLCA